MRLMTKARALHSGMDCARWAGSTPTVSADSRAGVHDAYAIALDIPAGQDSNAILEGAMQGLWAYRLFPTNRMRYAFCPPAEPDVAQQLKTGTTIVQRVFLGPLAVEMAVRVVDVFDHQAEDRRVGFTYVTLDGHMERGVASFFLRLTRTNELTFHIESWSRPGNWLAALGRPFARGTQKRFTQEALAHFAASVRVTRAR